MALLLPVSAGAQTGSNGCAALRARVEPRGQVSFEKASLSEKVIRFERMTQEENVQMSVLLVAMGGATSKAQFDKVDHNPALNFCPELWWQYRDEAEQSGAFEPRWFTAALREQMKLNDQLSAKVYAVAGKWKKLPPAPAGYGDE